MSVDTIQPSVGRIVHYKLTADNAAAIKRRRVEGVGHAGIDQRGAQAHVGNQPLEGDVVPLLIVRVRPNEYDDQPSVNGQAFLDGNDVLWITSAKQGSANGDWSWPHRV